MTETVARTVAYVFVADEHCETEMVLDSVTVPLYVAPTVANVLDPDGQCDTVKLTVGV